MPALVRHSYTQDFAAWASETADLIKQGQFQEVDVAAGFIQPVQKAAGPPVEAGLSTRDAIALVAGLDPDFA